MYQLIETISLNEPWYFFENWRDEIDTLDIFTDFETALNSYKEKWQRLSANYDKYNSQKNLLTAFWNINDSVWCDACGEYLQLFHGLILLENYREIDK